MKLVVAYRASEVGEKVLALAIARARQSGAQVYLVTSLVGGAETPVDVIEQARTDLDQAAGLLAANGIAAETHLLIRGLSAGEDVVQFVQEIGADEIIVGIWKKSKVGKVLFGSTAQDVILTAGCPVLTTK
ncbi:MAG: universal stress protein [Desulfobaccales bacterium]|jgi:nucleotide-binding universal stress UspA family protein